MVSLCYSFISVFFPSLCPSSPPSVSHTHLFSPFSIYSSSSLSILPSWIQSYLSLSPPSVIFLPLLYLFSLLSLNSTIPVLSLPLCLSILPSYGQSFPSLSSPSIIFFPLRLSILPFFLRSSLSFFSPPLSLYLYAVSPSGREETGGSVSVSTSRVLSDAAGKKTKHDRGYCWPRAYFINT